MPVMNEIYYVDSVRGKQSRALVWLHGAGGNLTQWPYTLRRFPGWRALTPDLPGHGRSGGQGQRSIDSYAQQILDWLHALGIESVIVGGHSMGAAIALKLAMTDQDLVKGLVLLGAGSHMEVNPQLLRQLVITEHLPGTIEQITKWSFHRQASPHLRQVMAKQLTANRPGVIYGDFTACAQFDIGEELNKIKQPALILCGEADIMMPASMGQSLAEGLVRGEARTISRTGHMMMQERPDEVFALVEEFLAGK